MYHFDASIHAQPDPAHFGDEMMLHGHSIRPLDLNRCPLTKPLEVSFEQASEKLNSWPNLLVEPDGSFVWSRRETTTPWQVDGVLYDRADRLLFVELRGCCPETAFDDLMGIFGWPATPLVFQLRQEALVINEADFRQFSCQAKS